MTSHDTKNKKATQKMVAKAKRSNRTGLYAGIAAVVVIGLGVWFFVRHDSPSTSGGSGTGDASANLAGANGKDASDDNSLSAGGVIAPVSGRGAGSANGGAAALNQYSNALLGDSFTFPTGYSADEQPPDDNGDVTVTVSASGGAHATQVAATPFTDDPSTVTAAKIHADIPDMTMKNTTSLSINGGTAGTQTAVAFDTDTTHEVWFADGAYLFQVSALLSDPQALATESAVIASFALKEQAGQ